MLLLMHHLPLTSSGLEVGVALLKIRLVFAAVIEERVLALGGVVALGLIDGEVGKDVERSNLGD